MELLISSDYIRSRYESTTDTRHAVYPCNNLPTDRRIRGCHR
nr:MAG TPA_asm: hypothetical protein [Caudoviricetes sp.]